MRAKKNTAKKEAGRMGKKGKTRPPTLRAKKKTHPTKAKEKDVMPLHPRTNKPKRHQQNKHRKII